MSIFFGEGMGYAFLDGIIALFLAKDWNLALFWMREVSILAATKWVFSIFTEYF